MRVLRLLTVAASISTALALPARAFADTTDYQAESMTWPAGSGDVYGATSADGRTDPLHTDEDGYYLWANRQGTASVTTVKPIRSVTVRLRSKQASPTSQDELLHPCKGSPALKLTVDTTDVVTWSVTPSDNYSTVSIDIGEPLSSFQMLPGTHTVKLQMTNDHLPTTNPCNREIYIDRFTLGSSQLFPDSSWRNKPLADNAPLVDQATSDRLVGSLVSQVNAYGTWVEKGDRFNVPVYTVPASQATVPVRLDTRYKTWWSADWSEWRKQFGNVPIPSYAKASGPTDCSGDGEFIGVWSVYAMCNGNQADWSDREIAIYQPATDTVWELEHLVKFNGEWSAIDGGRISNVSQAQQYDGQPLPVSHLYHGVAASRIPLLATIQRRSEVLNGAIHHPVAIAVPHVEGTFADRQHQLSPATFPALASDGDFATSDAIREGTWFRLPRSVPIDSLNMAPYARIFAHAAQDYGIIVTDKDCAAPDPTKPPPTGDPCMPPNRHADVGTSVEDPYPAYGAVTYGSSNDPYRNLIPSTSDGSSTALDGFPWDQLVVVAPPPQ